MYTDKDRLDFMQKRIKNLLEGIQYIASYTGPHTGEDVGVLMEIAQEAVQQDIALQHLNESDAKKCDKCHDYDSCGISKCGSCGFNFKRTD